MRTGIYINGRARIPGRSKYVRISSWELAGWLIVGEWLDDDLPYMVIHRIASSMDSHGVFREIMDYSFSVCGNIRIDTHRDNHIMQHVIAKAGFKYCGIIYLADGAERLAYQRLA